MISKEYTRPKSASYLSTYRSVVETPSKYQLPSLKPVMVRMTKMELSEEADLFNIDHIRPGKEKSRYFSLKLNEKARKAYQKRKEERMIDASRSIQSGQNELWLKRDQQTTEINANDVLFLECLRKDVLPYPLASVDKLMRKYIQFEDSVGPTQRHGSPSGIIEGPDGFEDEYNSQSEYNLADSTTKLGEETKGSSIIRSPNQSVLIPGTSVTDVRTSSILQLDLTERSIGNDRAICLADACQFCPGLQSLKIANNRLNDFSCAKLTYALLRYTQLTYLDMAENTLSKNTVELLGTCLAVRSKNTYKNYMFIVVSFIRFIFVEP